MSGVFTRGSHHDQDMPQRAAVLLLANAQARVHGRSIRWRRVLHGVHQVPVQLAGVPQHDRLPVVPRTLSSLPSFHHTSVSIEPAN